MNLNTRLHNLPPAYLNIDPSTELFDIAFERLWEASYPESDLKVYLKDNSASESPRPRTTTSRPGVTRGDQFTGGTPKPDPDTRTSQSSLTVVNSTSVADKADPVFADRQSGVVFTSGLIRATGDHVTVREFCKTRGLAPTLHLVIPSAASARDSAAAAAAAAPTASATTNNVEQQGSTSSNGRKGARPSPPPPVPSFSLTLPSPTTTLPSPIDYPSSVQRTFTRLSYTKEVNRAPRHMRIPHLPQYCAHTLRPFVPLTKCALCEIQILACQTWWNSRNPKHHAELKRLLRVPQVLPADCSQTTRSIYYALGLPLGDLDESCIDWDVVDVIMFMPSRPSRRHRSRQPPAAAFCELSSSSSSSSSSQSRIRVLFRRARRFLSIP